MGHRSGADKWSEDVFGPGAEGVVVEVSETPPDATWQFRSETTLPSRIQLVTGRYRPGSVDEQSTEWQPADEATPFLYRSVVIGDQAWIDTTGSRGWEQCRAWRPAFADKDILFRYDPDAPTVETPCSISNCPFVIGPGSRVPVRNPVESVVGGEHLTTYEVVARFADRPSVDKLRATITLDEARRLRGGKIWDAATGTVYFTLEAGPAPGNPPIVDPSGQPPFSSQPPPAPPTTATVEPNGG
jgi:hypothetical protein